MPIDTALNPSAAPPREIPHAVSPGLWTLAWRRLKTDSVAMVSLAIVAAFILLMIVSGLGLVAKDWAKEVGINYAPPSWITLGATDAPPPALPGGAAEPSVPAGPTPGRTPTAVPSMQPTRHHIRFCIDSATWNPCISCPQVSIYLSSGASTPAGSMRPSP